MSSVLTSLYGPVMSSGTVTSYLPLTTAWSAPAQCSSLFLDSGGNLYLNAPEYQNDMPRAPACMPPQISPWWYQSLNTASPTVTLLGGYDFLCPEAYTTVFSSVVDSTTTIGCCPSFYSFGGALWSYGNPWQCESTVPAGTITYAQPYTGSLYTTTSRFVSTPTAIWGVQVNGYIFEAAQTNSATTLNPATSTQSDSTSSSSIGSSSGSASSTSSSGLDTGDKIAIGVGLGVGVPSIVIALVAWLWPRAAGPQRLQQPQMPRD
ncbi:uncharacterized protein PAC_17875 [Phialocephala subalpina]|uniref:Uncharacterized protein n=1 Tax=Phialocephala subalpina TaxID=576137 RepID=A0A1L7XSE9_9HELO|nr:uncharacterized protein PAC_17875 [Phialocephala subalpina]